MTGMQNDGKSDTRCIQPTKANDAQAMAIIDKWLAARACTFEDAFRAILEGFFYSWGELAEKIELSHFCHDDYCDLNVRERKDERTRLLAHAIRNWQQGATIRSPMHWVLTFYENGLEAKWVSQIKHRSEPLASYQNIRELVNRILSISEEKTQTQPRATDPGRSKGGKGRHIGTFAYEVKRRIRCRYTINNIDLNLKEQKNAFIKQMLEMYVDEDKGKNGLSKPKAGVDLETMEPLKIKSRRTIEKHIRSLSGKDRVLAEHVVS